MRNLHRALVFPSLCWVTKEITRLQGLLPDCRQVCLRVEEAYFLPVLAHAAGAEAGKWKRKRVDN